MALTWALSPLPSQISLVPFVGCVLLLRGSICFPWLEIRLYEIRLREIRLGLGVIRLRRRLGLGWWYIWDVTVHLLDCGLIRRIFWVQRKRLPASIDGRRR